MVEPWHLSALGTTRDEIVNARRARLELDTLCGKRVEPDPEPPSLNECRRPCRVCFVRASRVLLDGAEPQSRGAAS